MQCIQMKAKILNRGDGRTNSMSQIRAAPRLAAGAKTGAIFVKKVTPSELILPLQTAGQRADCRGRGIQFSSGIFPIVYNFPDPLLIATSFANLEFSYRIISLRRIRFAWCLTAGAKFSSRNKKARDAGFITGS